MTHPTHLEAEGMTTIAVAVRRWRLASSWPGWRPLVSATCLAVVATLGVLAVINESALLGFDRRVEAAVLGGRTRWLDTAMVWLTFLGTRYAIAAIAGGLVLWSAITGKGRAAVGVIVLAALVNPVVEVAVKELVGRVRPNVAQLLPGNGPSFPSGHVLAAVGFYGSLPLLVWRATRRVWLRAATVAGAVAVIGIVAASRVYLDVHWTTDAVAGILLGVLLIDLTFRVHHARPAAAC